MLHYAKLKENNFDMHDSDSEDSNIDLMGLHTSGGGGGVDFLKISLFDNLFLIIFSILIIF